MRSEGTGSVSEIQAIQGKTVTGADRDGNGAEEITACFSKDDLRLLFANVQGNASVFVTFEGDLILGGKFRAVLDVGVIGTGGGLLASVSPNPLNPEATLTFVTSAPGPVRVSLFDLAGRLVRVLSDAETPEGLQRVRIDGRGVGGERLASGVYFYKVETPQGAAVGRVAILR